MSFVGELNKGFVGALANKKFVEARMGGQASLLPILTHVRLIV